MKIPLLLALIALTGCKSTLVNVSLPSGEKISFSDQRLFMTTHAVLKWPTTNGVASLDLTSDANASAISAAAQGAAAGAAQGVK